MLAIRPAAVAGKFYPADPAALRAQIDDCLAGGPPVGHGASRRKPAPTGCSDAAPTCCPKLLIVPHAGYLYSGPIAGRAYAQLAPWAAQIRRVVLLGPAHRAGLRGLALPTVDAFETPLGRVLIDRQAGDALAGFAQVIADDRAHANEHSLEVQLPFLQTVLGDSFRLLPLAVGEAPIDDVADVIERLWGGDETLFVISTDLSHYLPYQHACATDRTTVSRIIALATDFDPYEACGAHALNAAMVAARRHGLQVRLLDLRNSGDTAGDCQRVVGYAALALTAPLDHDADADADIAADVDIDVDGNQAGAGADPDVDVDADERARLGAALLGRARNSIADRLGIALEPEARHAALEQPAACFVTLRDASGRLRGCIGGLDATGRLADELSRHALAAAFADPRFEPLRAAEWPGLAIEVSLLEPPRLLSNAGSRRAALRQLQPGIDGVIVEWQGHRATFLPQVWAQLPQVDDFICALWRKAGLPADFWAADLRLLHYRVRHFAADAAAPRGRHAAA